MKKLLNNLTPSRASRFDGEDGCEHFNDTRARLRDTANAILTGTISVRSAGTQRLLGIETETSCIGSSSTFTQDQRDKIVASRPGMWDIELGAMQIETKTQPVDLLLKGGLRRLQAEVVAEDALLTSELEKVGAVQMRLGSNPLVALDDSVRSQGILRYQTIPDFHARFRRMSSIDGLFGSHPRVVGAFSSIQYNLDCNSPKEAIKFINHAFVTGPYAVALSANARFLEGKDTGYADIRTLLWEQSHDIRTEREVAQGLCGRVGLPTTYYRDLRDYFLDVHDQPTMLPYSVFEGENAAEPFDVATRLLWREVRLKFLPVGANVRQIVLEFRQMSVQPTAKEDYAMILFAVGHLMGVTLEKRPLQPWRYLKENRLNAARFGLDGHLWYYGRNAWTKGCAREALKSEFLTAVRGLKALCGDEDIIDEVYDVWCKRLIAGTPSDVMLSALQRLGPITTETLRSTILNHSRL